MLLESYGGVYGPLALVPMVLLWIYISWLLILLGAEIAHAFQNLSLLEAEERRQHGKEPINGLVATQLLAAVAAHHERGGPGIGRDQLAKDFGLSTDVVGRIVERLKEHGLIAEVRGDKVGLIPARAVHGDTTGRRAGGIPGHGPADRPGGPVPRPGPAASRPGGGAPEADPGRDAGRPACPRTRPRRIRSPPRRRGFLRRWPRAETLG